MSLQLTERERQVFSTVGYEYAHDPVWSEVTREEVVRAVLRVLRDPEARAVEACVLALVELGHTASLDMLLTETDSRALRRLGYLLDRLAAMERLDPSLRREFAETASQVERRVSDTTELLTLTDVASKARLRRLMSDADPVNLRWSVFGDVHYRDDPT